MKKLLFLDYRGLALVRGFTRMVEGPSKHPSNPVMRPEHPWEGVSLTLYGSVVKAPDRPYQLWYTATLDAGDGVYVAYAESDDGLSWRKPLLDLFPLEWGKTNIVLDGDPHGVAVIYDERESREDWRYKMLAGAGGGPIWAYRSADGIDWKRTRRFPVITTGPDCPMGFLRHPDGRYVAYHRVSGFGRRVCRSESWDFAHWSSEPRLVFEPDAGDPPLLQFYGMGSSPYGSYELGTLWTYHVDIAEPNTSVGFQQTELAYSRSGYAWHRAAQGTPFIPHGAPGSWEQGNLQSASSPVYLPDEIRFYYAATDIRHCVRWELKPQKAGLGLARMKPDRFVALEASDQEAELLTMPFTSPPFEVRVNARVEAGGWVRVGVCGYDGKDMPGLSPQDCVPVTGDSCASTVSWAAHPAPIVSGSVDPKAGLRLRIRAHRARLYSVSLAAPGEAGRYNEFEALW